MKKSANIQLLFLHGLILSAVACDNAPPPVDPCNTATFNQPACEVAVQQNGYHYHGAWVPYFYTNPYPFYFNRYNSYVARGGTIYSAPLSAYDVAYRSLDARAYAYAGAVTPRGTALSSVRMGEIAMGRAASIAGGRSGATVGRGGFGSIGSGHASFGG
jgi:hypothetical protein